MPPGRPFSCARRANCAKVPARMSSTSAAAGTTRRPAVAAVLFFAATWSLLTAAGASRMFRDPGTFWHLLSGERILQHGLPREDWLTFTFVGKPWIAHQWLAECAMALLKRLGGYDALLVTATAGLALLFTWTFQRFVGTGVQPRWAVLLTAFAILTGSGSFHVRPLLLSLGFFAWTFARLVEVEAGRARLRDLRWLLPLLVVWVNCHGAALGGIATIGATALIWTIAWATGRPSPVQSPAQAAGLAGLVLAAALTPLANPYGLELVRTWLAIVRSPVIAQLIVEHGSVWRTGSWYVLPFAAVYVLVYASAGAGRGRATALLPLVWLLLTLERIRHAPLFAIAALLALPELLPRSRIVAWLDRRRVEVCGGPAMRRGLPAMLWAAPPLLLALATIGFQLGRGQLSGPRLGRWPFALVDQLKSSRLITKGAPVLNDMGLGGFLAHELPSLRVFGDDRCELYGDAFLRDWFRGDPAWFAGWVSRFDVRIAVTERGTPLEAYLRTTHAWREVSTAEPFVLFLRQEAALEESQRP